MDFKIRKLKTISDSRGDLVVCLKGNDFVKKKRAFGQLYIVTFKKRNIVRGNHYHKKIREWFVITAGSVEVFLKDIKNGNRKKFILEFGKDMNKAIEVGPYIAHSIMSLSKHAMVLNYSDGPWSESDSFEYKLV